MTLHSTACPRNCYSTCAMKVRVEEGRITAIEADPSNPATSGGPCLKGLAYIERTYSSERLTTPLERQSDGSFKPIPWEMALYRIVGTLRDIREKYGPRSVFYYCGSGTKGLLNGCSLGFWKAFGGCTTTYGDLCWPAGLEATRLTLGDNRQSAPWDIAKAKLIVMWGKNPAETNIHQMRYIEEALKAGAKYVVIDPRRTQSAEGANLLLQPRPGTDGALALGLAHLILLAQDYDADFVRDHVLGFEEFVDLVSEWTPERTAEVTGIPEPHLRLLAVWMGQIKPMSLCAGFGMQRYSNAGQSMRALIALCAITGNIGIPGGGWIYANLATQIFGGKDPLGVFPPEVQRSATERGGKGKAKRRNGKAVMREYSSEDFESEPGGEPGDLDSLVRVSVSAARLGPSMLEQSDPPLKFAWVERGNPLSQSPETHTVRKAFRALEFRVVVDERMTETALEADLVLPAKSMFEQTDVIGAYWHAYLQLRPKLIDPPGEVRPETEIYWEMAKHLDVKEEVRKRFLPYPSDDGVEEWLEKKLEPVGITLEQLRQGPVLARDTEEVAFRDRQFPTPSGKIELLSQETARLWQLSALPDFTEILERPSESFPLHLLAPATKNAIHSQFHSLPVLRSLGVEHCLYMHPEDAAERGLEEGREVRVFNDRGELRLKLRLDFGLRPGVVVAYNGFCDTVNLLTAARETDMGFGAAFHDNAVQVAL